jgi:hypothetical protein
MPGKESAPHGELNSNYREARDYVPQIYYLFRQLVARVRGLARSVRSGLRGRKLSPVILLLWGHPS